MYMKIFQFSGRNLLIFIICSGIIVRMIFAFFYLQHIPVPPNYWEYGQIAQNLKDGKGYSYHEYKNVMDYKYRKNKNYMPSAFMPPGYVLFLYPFLFIQNIFARNLSIILLQTLISAGVIMMIYHITLRMFNPFSALMAALITAFLPEFIYASCIFGPVVHFHLLLLMLFYRLEKRLNNKRMLMIALITALIIYLRSEFVLYAMIFVVIQLYDKNFKPALSFAILLILFLSPWLVRNYIVFDTFVPLTTNAGFNFYRGHNVMGPGSWGDGFELFVQPGVQYEVEVNRIFMNRGLQYVWEHPIEDMFGNLKKVLYLWVIDLTDPRSGYFTYWFPWVCMLITAFIGLKVSRWPNRFKFEYAFFIYFTLIAFIFFTLPRYQTLMKIMLIPFAAKGVEYLWHKFKPERRVNG
jgi:hypothetical protein